MHGPGPPPPRAPQQEIDDIVRRLDILQGNTSDVSPDNTPVKILELLLEPRKISN